ncbi:MAG: hypothetical protein Q8K22_00930, partial [Rhodoferax sp.]|nr:hypothetical protein [Rhodoferax sp.]
MQFDTLMRRFTIRFRMLGAIVVVVISLGLVGAIGVAAQLYANNITMKLINEDTASLAELGRLQQAMASLRQNEKDMVIQYENSVEAANHKEAWTKSYLELDVAAKALGPLLPTDAQRTQLDKIMADMHEFRRAFGPMANKLESMGYESAQIAAANIKKIEPFFQGANNGVNKLAQDLHDTTLAHRTELQAAVIQVVWLTAGVTALLLALIVPSTIMNMNSICRPIDQAERMAHAIAGGDLTDQGINTDGHDE